MRRVLVALLPLIVMVAAASCGALYDLGALGAGADAGALEGSSADAQPRFCELAKPTPTFCADFDTADPLEAWDNGLIVPDPFVHGGGTFPGAVPSPDGSLAWVAEIVATKSSASAALAKNIVAESRETYLAFDVSVEGTDPPLPDQRVAIATITFGSTEARFVGTVTLAYDKKGGLYLGVSPSDAQPAEGVFVRSPVGRGWQRIEIILVRDPKGSDAGSGGGVEVFVDGSRVVRTGIPKVLTTRDDLIFFLGAIRGLEGADARVLVDNVIIDAR